MFTLANQLQSLIKGSQLTTQCNIKLIQNCMNEEVRITIIESPTHQFTEENLFGEGPATRFETNSNVDNMKLIGKRLEQNLRRIENLQPALSQKKAFNFKQLRNNILKINNNEENAVSVMSVTKLEGPRHQMENPSSSNLSIQIDQSKYHIIRNLHFDKGFSNTKENATNSGNKEVLNSFLQEIGEFKRSITQIREKFNQSNAQVIKKPLFQQASKQRSHTKLDYSRQKYSYTTYRDLSHNRGSVKRSYDRWRSNDKSSSFRKEQVHIHEFTIDASDVEPRTPHK